MFQELSSLDAKEIAMSVLEQLPDMDELEEEELQEIEENRMEQTTLVHFVDTQDNLDLEMRKLPALLGDYRVSYSLCNNLHASLIT